jgi:hypothetical protein
MYESFVRKTKEEITNENGHRKFNRESIDAVSTCFVHKHFSVRLTTVLPDKLHSPALRCTLTKEQECKAALYIGHRDFRNAFFEYLVCLDVRPVRIQISCFAELINNIESL